MNKIITIITLFAFGACSPLFGQDPSGNSSATSSQLGSLVSSSSPVAQDPVVDDKVVLKEREIEGTLSCARCHLEAILGDDETTDFVNLNEFQIWISQDPHSLAYLSIIPDQEYFDAIRRRLSEAIKAGKKSSAAIPEWGQSNERSQKILMSMFGDEYPASVETLFEEITRAQNTTKRFKAENLDANVKLRMKMTLKQCLSCHAGWIRDQEEIDPEVIEYGFGVGCESCHGAAGDWTKDHSDPDWRKIDPDKKESEFGLIDVRNPIRRSEQCYSCHIGNVKEGKFVTHEMYAAGHPPLPSIEMESFADQIPRHWRYMSEKKEDFEFAEVFGPLNKYNTGDYPRTRNMLVGGVMASSHSVAVLADSAEEFSQLKSAADRDPSMRSSKIGWPEFAAFDCAACHHDLKAEGWDRGFAGVPGRPPAQYWPRPLAKLGLAYLETKNNTDWKIEFERQQERVQEALDAQPFGQPAELTETGNEYSEWLRDKIAQDILNQPLSRDDAISVLHLLCGSKASSIFSPQAEAWDFHSARQMAWAINLVYAEIQQPRHTGDEKPNASNELPLANGEFELTLAELRESLMLNLPKSGQIMVEQKQYLSAWRDFDRNDFLEKMAKLRETSKQVLGASMAPSGSIPVQNVVPPNPAAPVLQAPAG